MVFLPVTYINRLRPPSTFACKKANEVPLNRIHPIPLTSQVSICTRSSSAWGTFQPTQLSPLQMTGLLSTLRPRHVHAGGWICHGADRLGRGVHRPERGLGRKSLESWFRRSDRGSGLSDSLDYMNYSSCGDRVCLEERQRESLNQSFSKCDL